MKTGSYYIYGKVGTMKRFSPLSGDRFCTNLIYADIYTLKSEDDIERMRRDLKHLNTQGVFELRKAEW